MSSTWKAAWLGSSGNLGAVILQWAVKVGTFMGGRLQRNVRHVPTYPRRPLMVTARRAFTLIELLVVISVIALLNELTMGFADYSGVDRHFWLMLDT